MSRLIRGVNDLLTWCLNNGDYGKQLIFEFSVKIKVLSEN